ncbi:MAG: galactose-1-phosphate uridylyltransferase [Candidatus Bathyarchaeota archaeon]|nr:MAG: galactose-1-phosphate uridylyltransferase [Candidatus Bathyarchaeota archaeon]
MSNEIRKDYILDRWVIIASERAKRPTDYSGKPHERAETKTCPFCPGNEKMTPPAFLLYLPSDGGIKRAKDSEGRRVRNWVVRCIPNLYPALTPRKPVALVEDELHRRRDGVGAHGVIIESPNHDEHPNNARPEQIELVVQTYSDLLKDLSRWEYVSIFRNHRKEAGASLSHAHSQIIATPKVPRRISDELAASRRWLKRKDGCPYCEIIQKERDSTRFIFENRSFIAFAPWASIYPFEFWLLPKKHQHTLLQLRGKEKKEFSRALRTCFGSLATILNDPPYSFGFHIAPNHGQHEYFHWHLEVYPKLSIQAGFENSTDMFINVTPPEVAAQSLKELLPHI